MTSDEAITKILSIRVDTSKALEEIGKYTREIIRLKEAEEKLKKEYKDGKIGRNEYAQQLAIMTEKGKALEAERRNLSKEVQQNISNDEKEIDSINGLKLALQKELDAYRSLTDAEKASPHGKVSRENIVELTKKLTEEEGALKRIQDETRKSVEVESQKVGSIARLNTEMKGLMQQYESLSSAERNGAEGKAILDKYEAVRREYTQTKNSIQDLSRSIDLSAKAESAQQGSLEQLRQSLIIARQEYVKMSAAEREGAQGKELVNHINEIDSKVKELEANVGIYQRQVGSYEEAIKRALGVNSGFANSLLNMSKSGGGIKGMFQQAGVAASAFSKTLMGFMANPVFLAIAGIVGAGAAFKWFYDYNKGIEEASRLTHEFLGVSGNEMKAVRNEIQAMADVYGKDFKETLEGVDALMAQYGLTSQEAMQIMEDGFQSGADLNGDMINKIKQYAPAFHDAGIAADEMIAIFQQTRSGIFSDGGLDLISMASKKIREMSTSTKEALGGIGISAEQVEADLKSGAKSTFDVIQEISGQLRLMPQDGEEVGAVLKDVFGRQGASAGLQMIEQLDTMDKDLQKLKGTTGQYGEALAEQVKAQEELNNVTSALFDMSDRGFGEMTVKAKTFVIEGITSILKGVVRVINYFIDWYNNSLILRGAVQAIVVNFKVLWSTVRTVFNLIIDAVKAVGRQIRALGTILEGIVTFSPSKVKEGWNQITSSISNTIKEVSGDIADFGKDAAKAYVDGFNKTLSSQKVNHLEIPAPAQVEGGGPQLNKNQQQGTTPAKVKTSEQSKKEQQEREKKEKAEAQHQAKIAKILADGEKKLLGLITSNLARQRQAINTEYANQIADLKLKLATERDLTLDAKQKLTDSIVALEQDRDRKLREFDAGRVKALADEQANLLSKQIELSQEGSKERLALQQQQIQVEADAKRTALDKSIEEQSNHVESIQREYDRAVEEGRSADELVAIHNRKETEQALLDTYNQQRAATDEEERQRMAQAQDEYDEAVIEKTRLTYENQINELLLKDNRTEEEQRRVLELQAEEADEALRLLEERGQKEGQTEEEFQAELLEARENSNDKHKAIADYEVEIEQAKMQATSQITDSLIKVMNAAGKENKAMAQLSKVVTLAQIAIDTGKALSSGIASASSLPYPANLAAIATTVATVIANVSTAISTVNSAKFAKGGVAGVVDGKYDDDDDRLVVRVNKGEMILNDEQQQRLFTALTGNGGKLTEDSQQQLFGIADGQIVPPATQQNDVDEPATSGTKPAAGTGVMATVTDEQRNVLERMVSEEVEVALTDTAETMSLRVGEERVALTDEQRSNVRSAFAEEISYYEQQLASDVTSAVGAATGDSLNAPLPDFPSLTTAYSEIGQGVNLPMVSGSTIADEDGMQEAFVDRLSLALEDMPAPVVSVEDINDGQRRVEVIENIDTM